MSRPDPSRAPLVALLLVAATLAAYAPLLAAGFIWDDDSYLTENPTIRDPGGLRRIWLEPAANVQYYPLTFTTFWLEYRLWGLAPIGYHLVNALLHAAAALLLWRILGRLDVPGALFAAALFALHPVAVESVAWITERKNVLSAVFYLSSALVFLRYALPCVAPPGTRAAAFRALPVAACVLFVCALLSKSVTASLPVALVVVLLWKRGRIGGRPAAWLTLMTLVGAAFGLRTAVLEKYQVGAAGIDWSLSLLERCVLAGQIFWFYLAKLAWPADLLFFYPRWTVDAGRPLQLLFAPAAVGLAVALWLLRRRIGTGPLTAVVFFAVTLFPVLGFLDVYPMRFSWVADHFQYLAAIGPITLFAAAASRFAAGRPLAWRAAAATLLVVLGALTWNTARGYRDLETLWTRTLEGNPRAWAASLGLGNLREAQGRFDEAESLYRRALDAEPARLRALSNLGFLTGRQGRWVEAVDYFERAAAIQPDRALGLYNLAVALGQTGEIDRAIAALERTLRLAPPAAGRPPATWAEAERREFYDPPPGMAHSMLARLLLARGRHEEAVDHFRKAIDERPDFRDAWVGLAAALTALGRTDEADAARAQAMRWGSTP